MTKLTKYESSLTAAALSRIREKRIANILRDELPQHSYEVVLNLKLAINAYNEQGKILSVPDEGEIDIVVIHQSGEIILIELKHGKLKFKKDKIIKNYSGTDKDVEKQIKNNKIRLIKQLKKANISTNPFNMLLIPDQNVSKINDYDTERFRIVDRKQVKKLPNVIRSLIRDEKRVSPNFEEIKSFFNGYFISINPPSEEVRAQNEIFESDVGYISEILSNVKFSPYRLKIRAVAGSGKSLFAYRFFDEKVNEKKSVMYVCYNNSLAKRTRAFLGNYTHEKVNNEVRTFHNLCITYLGENPDEDKFDWDDLPKRTRAALESSKGIPAKWQFDSIIVDEGQDFEAEWFEILKFFLKDKDKGDILWLEDPEQKISEKEKIRLDNFIEFSCEYNFRTPQKIANYILKNPKYNFTAVSPFSGKDVVSYYYSDDSEQEKIVLTLIEDLLNEGYEKEHIIILTCYGYRSSQFHKIKKLQNYILKHEELGKFNHFGEQKYTEGDIAYNSVRKYKGSDSPVVILVDIDNEIDYYDQILYCGMTRATNKLCLLYKKNSVGEKEKVKKNFIELSKVEKHSSSGEHYIGEWLEGEPHGRGTCIYEDGSKYEGEWRNGKQHGDGTYSTNDGIVSSGKWNYGVKVK